MRMQLRSRALFPALLVLVATAAAAQAADLAVTVSYTGKATVDAKHDILVFLFTDPNITNDSIPIAVQSVTTNGGTATFKNVTQDPVYVVMVYNEQGDYTGTAGPPPPGLPIGMHGAKDGKPLPVSPAKTPAIKTSFSDARRWGK
jgi:hypothetical protein